jgi:hypothetical protein
MFLLATTFRLGIGLSQPLVQWMPVPHSTWLNRSEREADYLLRLASMYKGNVIFFIFTVTRLLILLEKILRGSEGKMDRKG